MNSLKIIFGALLVVLAFSVTASAERIPYCIRVYCEKDEKTKVLKWEGSDHARIFAAQYDPAANIYFIEAFRWAQEKACGGKKQIWGTNAANYESLTSWVPVVVADPSVSIPITEACKKLQQ